MSFSIMCGAIEHKGKYSLYMLAHAFKILAMKWTFTIGKSIIHIILCKFKHVVDKIFNNLIWWVVNNNLSHVMGGLRTCQVYQVSKGQRCFHIHMRSLKFKLLQEIELFFQIKGVPCNNRTLSLTTRNYFLTSSWGCQGLWMTYFVCFQFVQWTMFAWRIKPYIIDNKLGYLLLP